MALDGLCIRALACEFNSKLSGTRIDKIYQPETDEIIITLHSAGKSEKLLLSANASIPRACLTTISKENPASPPMFCMLLRKHIGGGKVCDVIQPGLERILEFKIETKNDFGDLVIKTLIIEIMGRHSNIILADENMKISGAIKHIDFSVSSVRQILPGLIYEYPPSQDKVNPTELALEGFIDKFKEADGALSVDKFICSAFLGVSPLVAREIVFRAKKDAISFCGELDYTDILDLSTAAYQIFSQVKAATFSPVILENAENGKLIDFSPIDITQYGNFAKAVKDDSISYILDNFYRSRAQRERMNQRASRLLKVVSNNLARCEKKYEIQTRELSECEKKEKFRKYGELITANMYMIKKGDKELLAVDYTQPDMPKICIPLDDSLSPSAIAQKYFKRYNKLKNAEKHLSEEIEKTKSELLYLETVDEELRSAKTLKELSEIREELVGGGYIKDCQQKQKKKKTAFSPPEIASIKTNDGFTIFIGKNNKQNDYLTTKLARGTDLWFHAKDIPGSHVVIRHEHDREFSDEAILCAAQIAAGCSRAKNSQNVPVDYTLIKNVKKPSGAKPGFVIFVDNKTVYVTPKDYELL